MRRGDCCEFCRRRRLEDASNISHSRSSGSSSTQGGHDDDDYCLAFPPSTGQHLIFANNSSDEDSTEDSEVESECSTCNEDDDSDLSSSTMNTTISSSSSDAESDTESETNESFDMNVNVIYNTSDGQVIVQQLQEWINARDCMMTTERERLQTYLLEISTYNNYKIR